MPPQHRLRAHRRRLIRQRPRGLRGLEIAPALDKGTMVSPPKQRLQEAQPARFHGKVGRRNTLPDTSLVR